MSQANPAVLARLSELPEGQPVAVDASIDGEPDSLILFREGDMVRAWRNICPHAGRRLDWSPGQFLRSKEGLLICAVHGASFKLSQGGECVAGPCKGQSLSLWECLSLTGTFGWRGADKSSCDTLEDIPDR